MSRGLYVSWGLSALGVILLAVLAWAGDGTVTISGVVDEGSSTYTITVDSTSGMTVGDHFGARLSDGSGAIYQISSIVNATTIQVTDSEDEANADVDYGVPATGPGWFATPTTTFDLDQPPYQAKGWDAPMKRFAAVLEDSAIGAIEALTPTDGNIIVGDGTTWVAESGATARTSLGLAIGTDVQAHDAQLDDIAALAVTDGNIIVGDGANWVAEAPATARTSLGLAIGTDVQAYDADLSAIAALAKTDSNIIVGNGSTWVAESGATARTSLGLGSLATQNANAVTITGGEFRAGHPSNFYLGGMQSGGVSAGPNLTSGNASLSAWGDWGDGEGGTYGNSICFDSNVANSASLSRDNDNGWFRYFVTSAVANNDAYFETAGTHIVPQEDPYVVIKFTLTAVTNCRVWVGLSEGTGSALTDATPLDDTIAGAGILFDSASDTDWQIMTGNGSTHQVEDTGSAVSATTYIAVIDFASEDSVTIYVYNDAGTSQGSVTHNTSAYSWDTTTMAVGVGIRTTTTTTNSIGVAYATGAVGKR